MLLTPKTGSPLVLRSLGASKNQAIYIVEFQLHLRSKGIPIPFLVPPLVCSRFSSSWLSLRPFLMLVPLSCQNNTWPSPKRVAKSHFVFFKNTSKMAVSMKGIWFVIQKQKGIQKHSTSMRQLVRFIKDPAQNHRKPFRSDTECSLWFCPNSYPPI